MTVFDAPAGKDYTVIQLLINDKEVEAFLFSLGCFPGEELTVVTGNKNNSVIAVKDGRYCIDKNLAKSIILA